MDNSAAMQWVLIRGTWHASNRGIWLTYCDRELTKQDKQNATSKPVGRLCAACQKMERR